MKIAKKAAGALLAGAFVIASCGGSSASEGSGESAVAEESAVDGSEESAPAGSGLLSGTVPTVTGSQVDLAGFEGKDVLLWVWAPW